jgi:tRNA (uracil-5-)-methyltransferase
VAAAQYNIAANHIDNVQIIRMAAEEFTQAMNGVREFNRLQGIDLQSYQCETIFVDPPRSGWTAKRKKWCRPIRVFCTFRATRKRCAAIWKR